MLILASVGGCTKSAPAPAPAVPAGNVARLHWLGIQRLAHESNAAYFMSVWNLPESKQLVAETLDKLAVGLVASNGVTVASNQLSVSGGQPLKTNYQSRLTGAAALLRPLLEDVLQQESFVEVRQPTKQPGELALAIRLNERHASLWETNLAAVIEALTGSPAVAAPGGSYGWQLLITNRLSTALLLQPTLPRHLELTHAGDWTLVGLGPDQNALLKDLRARIRRDGAPASVTATNFWLEADLDLGRLASALALDRELLAGLPKLALTVIGAGGEVRTVGELKFAKPLPFEEAAWNIPTNLVCENLISFTALRGFRPWLSSQKVWRDLEFGATPNQVFFWAREGLPFLSYSAAPLPDASNCVARFTERLTKEGNAWMATNGLGKFLPSEKTNGVVWSAPFMEPYLESATVGGSDYVLGGLVHQAPGTNRPVAPGLFHEFTRRTNLVAYDWELTGPRLDAWLYTGQMFRLIFFRDRLTAECASAKWLKAAALRLGNCVTAVTLAGPDQLAFARRSAIGFSSVELHLLAEWLESPQFPRGYSSQVAHRVVPIARMPSGTNSVPVPRPK